MEKIKKNNIETKEELSQKLRERISRYVMDSEVLDLIQDMFEVCYIRGEMSQLNKLLKR